MSFSMKDKVVIITGGSKGIGLGIVTVFAKEQAKVVFTGRNEETGKQTQQQLKEQGLDTLFLASDVSDESSMRNLMKQVYELEIRTTQYLNLNLEVPIFYLALVKNF